MRVGLEWATGSVQAQSRRLREYRSFKKARAFVHSVKLKSDAEWRAYGKSGKKPTDIPASPTQYTPRLGGLDGATGSDMCAEDSHSEARS